MSVPGKVGVASRLWFGVSNLIGAPDTGQAANLVVSVRNPANSATATPTVVESGVPGLYYVDYTPTVVGEHGILMVKTTVPEAASSEVLYSEANNKDDLASVADRNADLIESQRGSHSWHGDYWYVDPANGNDANPGTRALPFATVGAAHTAATDSNHDVIFLVAGGAGITELDEQVTITKRYLLIRGPGNDFRWKSTSNGDVIQVAADGVELSGFRVQTHTTGSGRGVDVSGATFVKLHNLWVERSRGDGLRLLNCTNCCVCDNLLEEVGDTGAGDGITVDGTAGGGAHNHVLRNRVYHVQHEGISVKGATSDHTVVERNHVQGALHHGIHIEAGATRTEVDSNHLGDNALGDILDEGTLTVLTNNEQWAKEEDGNLSEVLAHLKNRMFIDFTPTPSELVLRNSANTADLHRWPLETEGGEKVSTQFGVQTKRGVPV